MTRTKLIAAAVVLLLLAIGVKTGWIPVGKKQASAVPTGFQLSSDVPAVDTPVTASGSAALPTTTPAAIHQPLLRINIWEWNAQFGLLFANGGPKTTKGSLLDKHGVSVSLTRQDDTTVSQTEQIKFAAALAGGNPNPSEGIHYTVIMGDQAAGYLASVDKELIKLGPEYQAEIIGAVGYSYGEDAWWGPQAWKDSPEAMKGGVTAGVLREGDWNITQYALANAGIKNNPDDKTWDPDAMNWVAAADYLKAAELYVQGYCEDRKVVRAGKLSGETKHICIDAVTTWTPGDVNLAKGKGGLVRLLSTRENVYQMPAVIVGIHKWDVTHAKQTQDLLAAIFEGSDAVKRDPAAMAKAGQVSYAVYADQSAGYWVKYFKGVTERDKTGQPVPLGGSRVANLADNLVLFGLAEGTGGPDGSLWKATYEGFGTIAKQQYPKLVPDFPKAAQAANTQFVQALAAQMKPAVETATLETFEAGSGPIESTNVVGKRSWAITFDSGKATFTPQAQAVLDQLYQQLQTGGALQVEVIGHTDATGNPAANRALSEARATAVKRYLELRAGKLFPEGRVTAHGLGDTQPIASNATEAGRAQNRRVVVTLGTKA